MLCEVGWGGNVLSTEEEYKPLLMKLTGNKILVLNTNAIHTIL